MQIRYRGKSIAAPRGTRLRTALLQNEATPHNEGAVFVNCRGLGTCGTCAVEVRGAAGGEDGDGAVLPTQWTRAERLRLHFPPHAPPNNQRLRLACQVLPIPCSWWLGPNVPLNVAT